MKAICKAEMIKMKRSSAYLLAVAGPIFTMILCIILTLGVGDLFQYGAMNWWYTMILPGVLALICASSIQRDSKINYYGVMSLPISKEKLWLSKIIICCAIYLGATAIMIMGTILGGALLGARVSLSNMMIAGIVLFITFLWQIPLMLLLVQKTSMGIAVVTNMFMNILGVAKFAPESNWFLFPFAIPSRLMCPIIGVLPNGLPVETGSSLLNTNVIIPGIAISIVLFVLLTFMTMKMFSKLEVR